MVADIDDGLLFVDLEVKSGKYNINLYKKYDIQDVRCVYYYKGIFYIVSNKVKDIVGLYLMKFNEKLKELSFLINLTDNWSIDEVNMTVLKGPCNDSNETLDHDDFSLVFSFST